MLTTSIRRAVAGALLFAPLAGCAHTGHVTHLQEVNVEVNNDLATPGDVKVYAQSTDGASENIGTAASGTKTLLQWVPGNRKKSYILIAERGQETPIKSQAFTPDDISGQMVSWTLSTNAVTFGTAAAAQQRQP